MYLDYGDKKIHPQQQPRLSNSSSCGSGGVKLLGGRVPFQESSKQSQRPVLHAFNWKSMERDVQSAHSPPGCPKSGDVTKLFSWGR